MGKKIVILVFMALSSINTNAQFYTISYSKCTPALEVASMPHEEVCTSDSSILLEDSDVPLLKGTMTNSFILDSLDSCEIRDRIMDVINEFSSVSLPLRHIHVTSSFGMRFHPIDKVRKLHNGIDLAARYDEVYAMLDGKVLSVGYNKASGNYVSLRHDRDLTVTYCHLARPIVKDGDSVRAGDIVAVSGNTGKSTNYHLHVSARIKGRYINPDTLLNYISDIKKRAIAKYAILRKYGFTSPDS